MDKTTWLVCLAFIEAKRKEEKEMLFSFLAPDQKKTLLSFSSPACDLSLGFDQVKQLLQWTHPSWFASYLRNLPEQEILLFLSVFPEDTNNTLYQMLLCSLPQIQVSPLAKNYLQKKIIQKLLLDYPDLPPIEEISKSSLYELLKLPSKEIQRLIDFLGLYDLANEMRFIIDKVRVKKIQAALTKEQLSFLSSLLSKQEPPLFKPIGLQTWNGTSSELLSLLHKRGMNRFSKALYPEDAHFVSYIKLRMSAEETTLFSSLHKKLSPEKACFFLTKQIHEVLAFFQKNKSEGLL